MIAVRNSFLILLLAAGCAVDDEEITSAEAFEGKHKPKFGLGYNVHLSSQARFEPIQPGADPERGRVLFGVAEDMNTQDPSGALFQGMSSVAGHEIVSNGRSCFSCHRGEEVYFGMPKPPLSSSIPPDDPLFTGVHADSQQDPDGPFNLENFGLIKYRPNRFNQARPADDPYRQVFFWRKSPSLFNVGLSHGFLLDGRARAMLETDRGAIFSHTQEGDARFDDLFNSQQLNDLAAFQFTLFTDPVLAALRDPSDPMYDVLTSDPFATVEVTTKAQQRGKKVFIKNCMVCHDAPNVFNHSGNLATLGTDGVDPEYPVFAPHVGRSFNIGVSERNKHGLRFTRPVGPGQFEPIVIPLANEDGTINMHTVTFDIGMAATTGRTVDIGRFKVPQLRNIRLYGPYFHDNSADTLEEVVDYFNSDDYNQSADGRRFPIKMNAKQRADLVEFLKIL